MVTLHRRNGHFATKTKCRIGLLLPQCGQLGLGLGTVEIVQLFPQDPKTPLPRIGQQYHLNTSVSILKYLVSVKYGLNASHYLFVYFNKLEARFSQIVMVYVYLYEHFSSTRTQTAGDSCRH